MSEGIIRNQGDTEREMHSPRTDSILTRIIKADESAVNDCLLKYGSLVWALARTFTDSPQDAETATQEIFRSLWEQCGQFDPGSFCESDFVFSIAYLHLAQRKQESLQAPQLMKAVALPLSGS